MRKPFTIKDLERRLEAVTLKPRDWVEAVQYVGPDRRRFNSAEYKGPRKRKADASGARFALVFGSDELAQGMVVLKPLRGEGAAQVMRPLVNVAAWAHELRAA